MKFFSSRQEFEYSWEEVSTNNWRKYCDWNNQSSHVIAVDTLTRTLDPSTHILRTERLITCKQNAPQWLRTFMGAQDTSLVYEVSYVDPHAKKVTMCSQNLTWSELLSVQETVVYTPAAGEAGRGRTVFEQRAKIIALCGGWQKIKNTIEEFTVERFRQNAVKGREGFERVLAISREVFAEQREQRRLEQVHGGAAVAA
ncbi:PRELI-like family-domain-containing protein [Neohortaea acidophila]|uniref:PRELI-like family-domain-containing protein n=1 Tax=Neohortaea acidophila TaxID=245834 RepID=A0A6A6PIT8_9PEZI|nr:PRELI-like family-domain-containing protein [Neohortaea acidophila]KAF2479950.1 PRELI-like family-domain-containing protein [Neohortaea acidophila]